MTENRTEMKRREYLIGDMSEIVGISRDTLRFYEKKGIINQEKKENGYRYYLEEDILRLMFIVYRRKMNQSLEEIEMQDGELKIDSDFYSVENGVYLSMYDSTGYFLYGKIPGGFDRQPDFLDGEVREIKDKAGEEDWYIYDLFSDREKVRRYMYAE